MYSPRSKVGLLHSTNPLFTAAKVNRRSRSASVSFFPGSERQTDLHHHCHHPRPALDLCARPSHDTCSPNFCLHLSFHFSILLHSASSGCHSFSGLLSTSGAHLRSLFALSCLSRGGGEGQIYKKKTSKSVLVWI